MTVTANNTNQIYGSAIPVFTASYSGFVNGDTTVVLSGHPSLTTTATVGSPVGGYTITATNGTLSATNYSFSFVNGILTVNPATLIVTANSTNRIYGGANPAFTASYGGFVNGDTNSVLSGAPSLATAATTASPTGNYAITVTNGTLSATNYTFSFMNGSLAVNPAALAVIANNTNRIYGVTNPVFTVSYSGFVNGDTAATLTGTPALTTSATTNSPVGGYVITNAPGSLSSSNYVISYSNAVLTVGQAVLNVTANDAVRGYGSANLPFTASYSGFVNGDTTNVLIGAPNLTTVATTGSPAAFYTISITQGSLSATNYSFNLINGTLTVTQAAVDCKCEQQEPGLWRGEPCIYGELQWFRKWRHVGHLNRHTESNNYRYNKQSGWELYHCRRLGDVECDQL